MAPGYLETFKTAYLAAALWTATNEDGEPLDDTYSPEDFAPEALARATTDCEDFIKSCGRDLNGIDVEQAGHDFWLTRNGHGAGFRDRGLGERGKRLTDAAHAYGSCDLYAGDDDLLYFE